MSLEMTVIKATTTKKFFGEPLFLGEVLKDLVSQALQIDRSTLRFEHHRTDDEGVADIAVYIDTIGGAESGELITEALYGALSIGNRRSTSRSPSTSLAWTPRRSV